MAPQDDLTAERAAYIYAKLGRGSMPDIRTIGAALKTARQEALREAAKVCRSNTYMSKDALDGGAFGGPGSCEYGCGDVIANELDRLASEGA